MILKNRTVRVLHPWIFITVLSLLCAAVCPIASADIANAAPRDTSLFKLPPHEKIKLENGLTVYLMEHHEVPMIYVYALFPAGAAEDGEKSGLAHLTAESLFSGTTSYSKKHIEENLEFLGVSYYAFADKETAGISMSFINTDQDKVLSILADVLRNAAFDRTEFEKRKKRLLLELTREKEQPALAIDAYFNKFIFGRHGYGNPVYGTRASVRKIRNTDARAFFYTRYRPELSVLAIVGDFQTPQMKKKVQELFEAWRSKGRPTKLKQPALPVFDKSRVLLVNKSDAAETRFVIGSLGISRNHPDYMAVQVVNTILGGRFTSLLSDALRVNAGLTYGAGSYFNTFKDSGTFTIGSFTGTENTVKAIDLALDVLNRLHARGINEETLASARNYLLGQFPPLYETAGNLASFLAAMFFYGIDESFINDFQKNVESVTVGKAREMITKHFSRDNLQFVLIGKAAALRDQVGKYGELYEKDIKSDGF